MFATTVSPPTNAQLSTFNLQLSTLSDRLAEATAEKMHEEVRKHYWGYAKDEQLSVGEMFKAAYRGIRPAVGYPSLPDQMLMHKLNQMIEFESIDITITENGALSPSSSVAGIYISSPRSCYFNL